MSSCDSFSMDDSLLDEEFDFTEEEDIAMLVAMHKRKKLKHGSSMFGHDTSRKRTFYPGSRGPLVPVLEPGLKGRY